MRRICVRCGMLALPKEEKCSCGGKLVPEKELFDKKMSRYFDALIKKSGCHGDDIARNCGFSASKLSKILRGQGMDLYTFHRLCDVLEKNPYRHERFKAEDVEVIEEFINSVKKLDTRGMIFCTAMIKSYIFGTSEAERIIKERQRSGVGAVSIRDVETELQQMKAKTFDNKQ